METIKLFEQDIPVYPSMEEMYKANPLTIYNTEIEFDLIAFIPLFEGLNNGLFREDTIRVRTYYPARGRKLEIDLVASAIDQYPEGHLNQQIIKLLTRDNG